MTLQCCKITFGSNKQHKNGSFLTFFLIKLKNNLREFERWNRKYPEFNKRANGNKNMDLLLVWFDWRAVNGYWFLRAESPWSNILYTTKQDRRWGQWCAASESPPVESEWLKHCSSREQQNDCQYYGPINLSPSLFDLISHFWYQCTFGQNVANFDIFVIGFSVLEILTKIKMLSLVIFQNNFRN